MINGMMTLSGAWHKLRDDPILRFLVVSLAFYGMSTFEGRASGAPVRRADNALGVIRREASETADNRVAVIRPTPR